MKIGDIIKAFNNDKELWLYIGKHKKHYMFAWVNSVSRHYNKKLSNTSESWEYTKNNVLYSDNINWCRKI